jgi:hypothetical protein
MIMNVQFDFRHLRPNGKAWHRIHALLFQARNRNRVPVQSLLANRVFSRPTALDGIQARFE